VQYAAKYSQAQQLAVQALEAGAAATASERAQQLAAQAAAQVEVQPAGA